jgi:hypothetical protein
MNASSHRYHLITASLFALIALLQLARGVLGFPLQIDGFAVPVAFAWPLAAIAAGLAFWGWRSR